MVTVLKEQRLRLLHQVATQSPLQLQDLLWVGRRERPVTLGLGLFYTSSCWFGAPDLSDLVKKVFQMNGWADTPVDEWKMCR